MIGPIYYEYGSVVVTFDNNEAAVKAFNCLKVSMFDDRNLLVMLLPNIQVSNFTLSLSISHSIFWTIASLLSYVLW